LTTTASGTAGHQIIYGRYGVGANPIITAGTTYFTLNCNPGAYLTFDGIDFINTRTTVGDRAVSITAGSGFVFKNGSYNGYSYSMQQSGATAGLTLGPGLTLTSAINHALNIVGSGAASNFVANNITVAAGGKISVHGFSNVTIANATWTTTSLNELVGVSTCTGIVAIADIKGAATSGIVTVSASTFTSGAITRVKGTLALGSGPGFSVATSSSGFSILYSEIVGGTYGTWIGSNSNNITIGHNKLHGGSHPVIYLHTVHDIIVEDNEMFASADDGFNTQNGCYSVTVRRNRSHDNGTKTNVSAGDGFSTHSTDRGIDFSYNMAWRNTSSGFALTEQSVGTMDHNIAVNNGGNWTGEGGVDTTRGGFYITVNAVNPTTGTTWTMTRCIGQGNYPVEVQVATAMKDLVAFDYNTYWPTNPLYCASIDSLSTKISWTTYHATYEKHSLSVNPNLVMP
jgi:hypothetical protein